MLKRNLSCQWEVLHNLNGHPVCHLHFQHMRNYAMKTKHFQRYYEYKKGVRDFDSVFIPVPKAFAYEEAAINPLK